jgi:UDP-glucose 4-epimerase
VIAKTHSKSKIVYVPYSEIYPANFEDMQRRVPDISKIKMAIGWQPIQNLDSIIESVARYLKN